MHLVFCYYLLFICLCDLSLLDLDWLMRQAGLIHVTLPSSV